MIMGPFIAMDQIKTWWSVLIYIQIEQHHSLDSLPRNQIALINYKMEFKQQEVLEDLTSKGWCSIVELRSRRISWDQSQQVKCFRCCLFICVLFIYVIIMFSLPFSVVVQTLNHYRIQSLVKSGFQTSGLCTFLKNTKTYLNNFLTFIFIFEVIWLPSALSPHLDLVGQS